MITINNVTKVYESVRGLSRFKVKSSQGKIYGENDKIVGDFTLDIFPSNCSSVLLTLEIKKGVLNIAYFNENVVGCNCRNNHTYDFKRLINELSSSLQRGVQCYSGKSVSAIIIGDNYRNLNYKEHNNISVFLKICETGKVVSVEQFEGSLKRLAKMRGMKIYLGKDVELEFDYKYRIFNSLFIKDEVKGIKLFRLFNQKGYSELEIEEIPNVKYATSERAVEAKRMNILNDLVSIGV